MKSAHAKERPAGAFSIYCVSVVYIQTQTHSRWIATDPVSSLAPATACWKPSIFFASDPKLRTLRAELRYIFHVAKQTTSPADPSHRPPRT